MRFVPSTIIAILLGWASPLFAETATQVSQYGITWTFDSPHEVGQFASGDYWVVGPVNIVSVSPAPTGTRNGSAVNPRGGRQGYDDRGGEFSDADTVAFPYALAVDASLVSSISKPDGATIFNYGCLQAQAVLTAVAAPVSATTLRPSYAGTYKRYFDTASIHWELLPDLPPPAQVPDAADLLRQAERPRIDHLSSWEIQSSCAEDNWYNGPGEYPCYGREYSTFVSQAAQFLMLDTPQRDALAISMIQLGIDNFGVIKAGGTWQPNGGHSSGRKWPIVFAARLLNDCDMQAGFVGDDSASFGEDGQTYYGVNSTALFGWDCGGGQGSFFENGCTGAGAEDCRDPSGMVDGCSDYRNCCTSAYWVGQMLAALMIDAKAIWHHDAYFDYVDRWMTGAVGGGGDAATPFIAAMWSQYRAHLPAPPAVPACDAQPGQPDAGVSDPGGSDASPGGSAAGNGGGCGCETSRSGFGFVGMLAMLVALVVLRRRS